MQPVTEVAGELYALTPAEFTAARDARAREARQAGQRDDAAAIKKLARPTTSAWLVNQLSRQAPEQLRRLIAVAEALEEAQRTLAGGRLRELSGQRRGVINDLLPCAADIASRAGQPASTVVMGEVRATLEAALADAAARAAVHAGRLTKPLAYAGLGEVDLAAALALPGGESRAGHAQQAGRQLKPGPGPGTGTGTRPGPDRRAAARRSASGTAPSGAGAEPESAAATAEHAAAAVQAAANRAAEAGRALQAAERQLAGVAERRQFLRRRIEHLKRELGEASGEDAELARTTRESEQHRAAAARELRVANRQLDQARRAATRHDQP